MRISDWSSDVCSSDLPRRMAAIDAADLALTDAGVAELVDAPDLGSGIARCGGSSPFARTRFVVRTRRTSDSSKQGLRANADCRDVERGPEARLQIGRAHV